MDLIELGNSLKDSSIAELQNIISKKMLDAKYGTYFCEKQTFNGLYRARSHNDLRGDFREGKLEAFVNERDFWNPPESKIKWYGRCNDIGESMFYCSNEFEVAVAEVRPSIGKYITVCVFKNIDFGDTGGRPYGFRMKPIGIDYLSKIESFTSCVKSPDRFERNEEYQKMDDFLDELFHEIVGDDENFKYKLSIAVTKIMLTKTINQYGVEHSMHGLMYASIIRNFRGVNILLKPQPVNNFFFLETAQTFEVLASKPNQIALRLVRHGRTKLRRTHPSQPKMEMEWFEVRDGEEHTIPK